MAPAHPAALRLAVHGANGRMGSRVCRLAAADSRFQLVAEWSRADIQTPQCDGASAAHPLDVIIDFSSASGAMRCAAMSAHFAAALVICSTGLSAQNLDEIGKIARSVAVLIAPNTSRFVALMNRIVGEAALALGAASAIEISETHHVHKRDAPSGTAKLLAKTIALATGRELPPASIVSRRVGAVVGEHEVIFNGPKEILKISHFCLDRDVFALGALDAAAWLAGRPAGVYGMDDVVATDAEMSKSPRVQESK